MDTIGVGRGWNLLLGELGLIGHGAVDPVVRGSYKGTVELSVYRNRVVIVASDSPLVPFVPDAFADASAQPELPGSAAQAKGGSTCAHFCAERGGVCSEQQLSVLASCNSAALTGVCDACFFRSDSLQPSVVIDDDRRCYVPPLPQIDCERPADGPNQRLLCNCA